MKQDPKKLKEIGPLGRWRNGFGSVYATVTNMWGSLLLMFCSVLAPAWLQMGPHVMSEHGRGTETMRRGSWQSRLSGHAWAMPYTTLRLSCSCRWTQMVSMVMAHDLLASHQASLLVLSPLHTAMYLHPSSQYMNLYELSQIQNTARDYLKMWGFLFHHG